MWFVAWQIVSAEVLLLTFPFCQPFSIQWDINPLICTTGDSGLFSLCVCNALNENKGSGNAHADMFSSGFDWFRLHSQTFMVDGEEIH